jgi:uncharacterized delta-60 repeat protein
MTSSASRLVVALASLLGCTPLIGSAAPDAAAKADVSARDVSATEVSATDVSANDASVSDAPSGDVATSDCGPIAMGAPGSRDPAFRGGAFPAPFTRMSLRGVALDRRGRALFYGFSSECHVGTSGDFAIVRHTADGDLDETFGVRGAVCIPNPHAPANLDQVLGLDVDAQGRIYAVGVSGSGVPRGVAMRLRDNGRLDTTFGADGLVEVPLSRGRSTSPYYPTGLVITDAGLYVVGGSQERFGFVVRLDLDGRVDRAFDGSAAAYNTSVMAWFAVGRAGDHLLLVGTDMADESVSVLRVALGGTLDTRWGDGGYARALAGMNSRPVDVEVFADGSLVVAAARGVNDINNSVATLARFTADGRPDETFGESGVYFSDWYLNPDYEHTVLASDCEGRLLFATSDHVTPTFTRVRIDRIDARGRLDDVFAASPDVVFGDGSYGVLGALVDPTTQAVYLASRAVRDTGYAMTRLRP